MMTDQDRERARQLTRERTQARQTLEMISNSLRFARGEDRKRLYNQAEGLRNRIRYLNNVIGLCYEKRREG